MSLLVGSGLFGFDLPGVGLLVFFWFDSGDLVVGVLTVWLLGFEFAVLWLVRHIVFGFLGVLLCRLFWAF